MSVLEGVAAVVFDVDDTLVMTARTGFAKCQRVAELLGCIPPTQQQFKMVYGKLPFDACIRIWHPQLNDIQRYQAIYDQLHTQFPDHPCGHAGMVISYCRRAGCSIGILTNGPAAKTLRKLHSCSLGPQDIDGLWHSENLPYHKPDPRAFDPLLRAWHLAPSQVLYIGDALSDLEAAQRAHVRFAAVLTGILPTETFSGRVRPDHILSSIDDLLTSHSNHKG